VCRCVRWLDACNATDTCDGHTVLWGFGGHAMVAEAFCSDSYVAQTHTVSAELKVTPRHWNHQPCAVTDGCTDLMLGSYGMILFSFVCAREHVCKRHGDTVRLQGRL
jgi:hypothetical protein